MNFLFALAFFLLQSDKPWNNPTEATNTNLGLIALVLLVIAAILYFCFFRRK